MGNGMRGRRVKSFGILLAMAMFALLPMAEVSAQPQGSYDTIRIEDNGVARLYQVSIDWSPLLLPLPDGGAWAFFTAQLSLPTEPGADPVLTNRRLFATRFDASTSTWLPATALPGEISFGPTGVIDNQGAAHVVYSIRSSLEADAFSTLVYIRTTDDGNWTGPVPVAPSETAGHQLSADLAVDQDGGIHLVWQDQRAVDEETRLADPSNADVFVSDLTPDGTWTEPVQVNVRPDNATNASRPQIAVDGDRLIVAWSVYSLDLGLGTASSVNWSTRPITDATGWSEEQVLLERGDSQIGGRFLDMASNPGGGASLVFGRRTETQSELYFTRLESGAEAWSEPSIIAAGNRGSYPRLSVANDGTSYITYNLGSGLTVQVGAIGIAPGQTVPGVETALTQGEEGAQGIPTVAVDSQGRVTLVYFHEPPGRPANEVRVLRAAVISTDPVGPVDAQPVAPEATPAPDAADDPGIGDTPEAEGDTEAETEDVTPTPSG
jgi:hypothetical protein